MGSKPHYCDEVSYLLIYAKESLNSPAVLCTDVFEPWKGSTCHMMIYEDSTWNLLSGCLSELSHDVLLNVMKSIYGNINFRILDLIIFVDPSGLPWVGMVADTEY